MAYKDFINDFKKGITGDVLFFYGAEDYLMDWAVRQVIDRYVDEASRSIDVRSIEGDKLSAWDIMGEARTYSMFSEKRVIVVRNYLPLYRKGSDAGADDLLGFAKEKQDTSVVIFTLEGRYAGDLTSYAKKFIKAASAYEFAPLDRPDLKSFINRRVQGGGKIIGRRELDYLIDVSGYYLKGSSYSLTQLDADLAKMIKACDGDSISAGLIDELLIGETEKFVFDLVDAVVSGKRSKALSITEAIIHEEDGTFQVIALLTKQFEIMYDSLELSKDGYSISQMAKMTGVNEYRFKKAYMAAQRYRLSRIRELLVQLYNIDRDIKRGDIDKDIALELFAVTACPA